jgi:hypothetical protein
MNRSARLFYLLAIASILKATAGHADESREMKILARGEWPYLPTHTSAGIGTDSEPRLRVVRNGDELAKAAGANAQRSVPVALNVEAIDFKKQMLLTIEDGTQPLVGVSSGGAPSALYAVAITLIDLDEKTKTMTVHWRRVPRGKNQGILTRPLEAVLVKRFDGQVTFNRLPAADQPAKEPAVAGKAETVVARAFWPDGWPPEAARKEWFIRDPAELIDPRLRAPEPVLEKMRQEAKTRYVKALKVDDIDLTKQMILGVSGGVQPAGSQVEVMRVATDAGGKTLTVEWRLRAPAKDSREKGITHPAQVVLVEQFAGEIRFRRAPVDKD